MIPLKIVLILMLHHTPNIPKTVADNTKEAGILRALKTIPIIAGIEVFPNPLNAPAEAISIVIKN